MALTILECLHGVEPKGVRKKNMSLNIVHNLVKKHLAEIEEARERGYSWRQIEAACRSSWEGGGKLTSEVIWWKTNATVEGVYRELKSNAPLHGKVKKEVKKPLSLEVTVTER